MSRKLWPCLICEKRYAELEEAEICERSHAVKEGPDFWQKVAAVRAMTAETPEARTRLIAELRQLAENYVSFEGEADSIAVMLREAADALAAEDWQPIETAPHGEAVLLSDGRVTVGYQSPVSGLWEDSLDEDGFTFSTPTHWRPLPAPPDRSRA